MAMSFVRSIGWAILAQAGAALAAMAAVEPTPIEHDPLLGNLRRRRPTFKRGKGKQAKPRKRPNMLHVSRRTRRKHRRAA